jgi:hypothetical protein
MKNLYSNTLRYFTPMLLLIGLAFPAMAQETDSVANAKMAELAAEQTAPVKSRAYSRSAFECGLLFDAQTATIPTKKTLEMVIQHRFGSADNGIHDLYGIWAPSNIRLGLNFSLLDNLMVGIGTTKTKKMTDLQVKYNPIRQTRDNKIPLTVTLYANMAIDGRPDATWGTDYRMFNSRFSYFSQLLFTRRFSNVVSLQVGPSFSHYNNVDSISDHDKLGISAAARFKFSPQTSFIIACDWPLQIKQLSEHTSFINPPKPNATVGFEMSTGTHAFHIYIGTAQNILPQEDMMMNQNKFNPFRGNFLIGLNITRLWSF